MVNGELIRGLCGDQTVRRNERKPKGLGGRKLREHDDFSTLAAATRLLTIRAAMA
jgi:hypothetical protein